MDKTKKLFQNYVNAGSDLAESVRKDIAHDGSISEDTEIALNEFIIATNEMADLQVELDHDMPGYDRNGNETDEDLN